MPLQSTDLFAINRGGVNYKITAGEFNTPGTLQGTDLIMVQRGGTKYKLSISDLYSTSGKLQTTDFLIVERDGVNYSLQPDTNIPGTAPHFKFLVNDSGLNLQSVSYFALQYRGAQAFNGVPPQLRIPGGDIVFLQGNDFVSFNAPIDGVDFFELYGQFDFLSFAGSRGLTAVISENPATSMLPNPSATFGDACFFNCIKLEQIPTNMPFQNGRGMFQGCSVFNQDVSSIDTSTFTTMNSMFRDCTLYNKTLAAWDVSSVTDMGYMFRNAPAFQQPLNTWGPSLAKVENFIGMFDGATIFNRPLDTWDVSAVPAGTGLNNMFKNAAAYTQDLTGWCVTNFPAEPLDFSTGSSLTNAQLPLWGQCP